MKYVSRPLGYKSHAALYEHDGAFYIALAGDWKLIASEGVLVPCTRIYHAYRTGDVRSYRPIVKLMGQIDISLAISILEEKLMVVDELREKASNLMKEALYLLEDAPDKDVHETLEEASQLYYELTQRSIKLHFWKK